MDTNYTDNNHIILVGKVTSDKVFSHEVYGERFFIFKIEIPRLSGTSDVIPITISERLLSEELKIGEKVVVKGQFRSYNTYVDNKNRLILTVFAKDIITEDHFTEEQEELEKQNISNEVVLNGYICKAPIYRQTPFKREIADILLAVNRAYNKSDYIPCIAWGRNARYCQNMEVGTCVKIVGRVQSRIYEKKYEDGRVEERVAYEVSIGSMEIVNQDNDPEAEDVENTEKEAM